jgi:hypothetical protein
MNIIYLTSKQLNKQSNKKNITPSKKTIQFILNYSKSLKLIETKNSDKFLIVVN